MRPNSRRPATNFTSPGWWCSQEWLGGDVAAGEEACDSVIHHCCVSLLGFLTIHCDHLFVQRRWLMAAVDDNAMTVADCGLLSSIIADSDPPEVIGRQRRVCRKRHHSSDDDE